MRACARAAARGSGACSERLMENRQTRVRLCTRDGAVWARRNEAHACRCAPQITATLGAARQALDRAFCACRETCAAPPHVGAAVRAEAAASAEALLRHGALVTSGGVLRTACGQSCVLRFGRARALRRPVGGQEDGCAAAVEASGTVTLTLRGAPCARWRAARSARRATRRETQAQGSPPLVSTPSRASPRTPPAPERRAECSPHFPGGVARFWGGVPARAAGGSRGGLRRAEQGS